MTLSGCGRELNAHFYRAPGLPSPVQTYRQTEREREREREREGERERENHTKSAAM